MSKTLNHYLTFTLHASVDGWGALEMHCGSVHSVGSMACMKLLVIKNVTLSGSDGSIRSWLCKYPTVTLLGHSFVKQPRIHVDMSKSRLAAEDFKMEEKVSIAVGHRPILFDLYTYRDNTPEPGMWSDLIGCRLRLQ